MNKIRTPCLRCVATVHNSIKQYLTFSLSTCSGLTDRKLHESWNSSTQCIDITVHAAKQIHSSWLMNVSGMSACLTLLWSYMLLTGIIPPSLNYLANNNPLYYIHNWNQHSDYSCFYPLDSTVSVIVMSSLINVYSELTFHLFFSLHSKLNL